MHTVLFEGVSNELEVFEGDHLNLKIRMRDRIPPLIVKVKYAEQTARTHLHLYLSSTVREPNEQHNSGSYTTVSSSPFPLIFVSAKLVCSPRRVFQP